jgi:GMP reductase
MEFKDISIIPQYSEVPSRSKVSLNCIHTTKHSNQSIEGIPVFVSNMDSTGTFTMAKAVNKHKMFTCLHKYYSYDELENFFKKEGSERAFVSSGLNIKEVERASALVSAGLTNRVCFDVANGYIKNFHTLIKEFREVHPEAIIIAGNVATMEGVVLLDNAGADIIKCGIANGSACDTSNKAGICIPQPDVILDCSRDNNICIMSDGGCKTPADIVKAFALGSEFVMCGGMFAGHDECDGEWLTTIDGTKEYFKFYGMSSKKANEKYNGGMKEYRTSEGKELWVKYKGPVEHLCLDIKGGLVSACTYTNSSTLIEFFDRGKWKKIC